MRKKSRFSRAIAAALALSLCFGSVSVQAAEPATEAATQTGADVTDDDNVDAVATASDVEEAIEVTEQAAEVTEQGEALDEEVGTEITDEAVDETSAEECATATDADEEEVTESVIEATMPSTLDITSSVNITSMPTTRTATIFSGTSSNPPSTVYKFKPTKSGVITYYSTGSLNTYGAIFDEAGKRLFTNISDGEGNNFKIEYVLEAGKAYYFALMLYSGSTSSNTVVNVNFKYSEINEGWTKVNDEWYYIQNGSPIRSKGLKIGSDYYYFRANGKAYRNTVSYVTMPEWGYGRYGFDDSCKMIKNAWLKYSDQWYYFGSDGRGLNGMQTVNGVTYNFYDGRMQTDSLYQKDGYVYYFGDDGKLAGQAKLVDGWILLGDTWVYCKSGQLMEKGWVHDNYWYYIADCKMVKDKNYDIKDNDGTYHTYVFDEKGRLMIGWIYMSYYWLYAGTDGALVKAELKEIDGATYFFDSYGEMISNSILEKDKVYYHFGIDGRMDEKKVFKDGWNKFRGDWYYMKSGSLYKSTFLEYNGDTYYFDSKGVMIANKSFNTTKGTRYFDDQGHMVIGWYQNSDGQWYYMDEDGGMITGLHTIAGKTYYFSSSMVSDRVVYTGGVLYYFGKKGYEEEKLTPKEGWNKFHNKWYYYKSGSLLKSTLLTADDGYTYYFDSTYVMCTNKYVYSGGKYHYFDEKGHMATGWVKAENGTYYCFDENGNPYTGLCEINGKLYSFTSGTMRVSDQYYDWSNSQLVVIDAFGNAKTYKSTANGWVSFCYYLENGKLAEGWRKIDGYWFYFVSGSKINTSRKIDGNTYVFDDFGRLKTGWYKNATSSNNMNPNWCYSDENGVAVIDGWKKINNKWYYFEGGFTCVGIKEINGKKYLFDNQGTYIREITEKSGWIKEGTKYYYIDADGNVYKESTRMIDNEIYAFDEIGVMITNENMYGYYFGADGKAIRNKWLKIDGEWAYFDEYGYPAYAEWLYLDRNWYYFDNYGHMVTGSKIIDGNEYNFDKNGVWDKKTVAVNGWKLLDGVYYYYKDGKTANGLCTIDGVKYYFDNGQMVHNRLVPDVKDYLVFGNDGMLARNSWVKLGGNDYVYADAAGHAVDGYQTINGKNYYFSGHHMVNTDCVSEDFKTLYQIDASGAITKKIAASGTGWVKTANGNYAYSLNGKYLNGYQVIAKKVYYFDYGILVMNGYVEYYGYFGKSGALEAAQGWVETKSGWMYFINGETYAGAAVINGKDYYFAYNLPYQYGDAEVGINGLVNEQGEIYYYNVDAGTRKKLSFAEGWNYYNGQWVYVKNGRYVDGIYMINGEYYWFSGGILQTNCAYCIIYNTPYVFFGADGKILKSQWITYNGEYYYANENGFVVTGIQKINGIKYVFASNGKYIGRL